MGKRKSKRKKMDKYFFSTALNLSFEDSVFKLVFPIFGWLLIIFSTISNIEYDLYQIRVRPES
jgi:hypothetical protein